LGKGRYFLVVVDEEEDGAVVVLAAAATAGLPCFSVDIPIDALLVLALEFLGRDEDGFSGKEASLPCLSLDIPIDVLVLALDFLG
jgi:hypothetical protein